MKSFVFVGLLGSVIGSSAALATASICDKNDQNSVVSVVLDSENSLELDYSAYKDQLSGAYNACNTGAARGGDALTIPSPFGDLKPIQKTEVNKSLGLIRQFLPEPIGDWIPSQVELTGDQVRGLNAITQIHYFNTVRGFLELPLFPKASLKQSK